jgi:hypothetical protein
VRLEQRLPLGVVLAGDWVVVPGTDCRLPPVVNGGSIAGSHAFRRLPSVLSLDKTGT